jgi:hypothetical protein
MLVPRLAFTRDGIARKPRAISTETLDDFIFTGGDVVMSDLDECFFLNFMC